MARRITRRAGIVACAKRYIAIGINMDAVVIDAQEREREALRHFCCVVVAESQIRAKGCIQTCPGK